MNLKNESLLSALSIVLLYLSTLYNEQRKESHKIQHLNVIKQDFVDRNAEISSVLTNHVSMKFSNKLIFVLVAILFGGFDNEKVTSS